MQNVACSVDYDFFWFVLFRNLQAMQTKVGSNIASSISQLRIRRGFRTPGRTLNVTEPVERISEDIAQVYNIACVTVTEQLKHELNSVVRGFY